MQPFDSLTLHSLIQEIRPKLINKRVDKLHAVDRHSLIITFKPKTNLFISINPVGSRLCLKESTDEVLDKSHKTDKIKDSNNFSVILKKYLTNAKLTAIDTELGERIVNFVFLTNDALGNSSYKNLICEIMGKHSNLILIDQKSLLILAVMHSVTHDMSRQRQLLANIAYTKPSVTDKTNIFNISREDFIKTFSSPDIQTNDNKIKLSAFLIQNFKGLGKDLTMEIINSLNYEDNLASFVKSPDSIDRLWFKVNNIKANPIFEPGISSNKINYTVLNLSKWPNLAKFPSINQMVDAYYSKHEESQKFSQLQEKLLGKLKLEQRKLEDKIITIKNFLANQNEIDILKKYGDLIYANISDLNENQASIIVFDYENNANIEIPINLNFSITQNAQNYYKQYQKAKLKQKNYKESLGDLTNKLNDVLTEVNYIEQCKTYKELLIQRKESSLKEVPKKNDKSTLLKLSAKDGSLIFIGRNSYQNDELFSKIARPEDYWFHVLGVSGAHVLLRLSNPKLDPASNLIEEAARLAAKFSKNKDNTKILVIYTKYKYVTKINRGKAGQVKYEKEKTVEITNNWSILNTSVNIIDR